MILISHQCSNLPKLKLNTKEKKITSKEVLQSKNFLLNFILH